MPDTLRNAAQEFLNDFELVFKTDWRMTKTSINDPHLIREDGTFLEPKIEDESNNWGNRGSLLASYRRLKSALER